jgi:hypothetical protein
MQSERDFKLTDPPPLQPAQAPGRKLNDWLRPGALTRLLDPAPPYVTGLSDDFLNRRYGHNWAREGGR